MSPFFLLTLFKCMVILCRPPLCNACACTSCFNYIFMSLEMINMKFSWHSPQMITSVHLAYGKTRTSAWQTRVYKSEHTALICISLRMRNIILNTIKPKINHKEDVTRSSKSFVPKALLLKDFLATFRTRLHIAHTGCLFANAHSWMQEVEGGHVLVERLHLANIPSVTDLARWFLTGANSIPGHVDEQDGGTLPLDLVTFSM